MYKKIPFRTKYLIMILRIVHIQLYLHIQNVYIFKISIVYQETETRPHWNAQREVRKDRIWRD